MPIRLSGLSSGLDTESLVSALMSSYNLKKDNLVKAQTKLSWKQDSWKSMNTSIYNFYTGILNSAKQSKTYNVKSCSISNPLYAKVSAATNAVNGTQSLVVSKLAATGYLTGGKIAGKTETGAEKKLDKNSKLSEIVNNQGGSAAISGGSISVTVDGKSTTINLSGDMSIDSLVSKFKGAGLNANFDDSNQRIFLSAPTSGKGHDFTLTGNDVNGIAALQKMGLYTTNLTDKAEYDKWAAYYGDDKVGDRNALKQSEYEKQKIDWKDEAKQYAAQYNNAIDLIERFDADHQSASEMRTQLTDVKNHFNDQFDIYIKKDERNNPIKDANDNFVYDTDKIADDGLATTYTNLSKEIATLNTNIKAYDDATTAKTEASQYVNIVDGRAVALTDTEADRATTAYANLSAKVNRENNTIKQNSDNYLDAKINMAHQMVSGSYTASEGAVRVVGQDAEIELNGAKFTNNTNNFTVNGLTISVTAETGGTPVSITTESDVDGAYNAVKSFIKEYNTLIKAMDSAYNATSSKGYEPLTAEEKKAMSDDEIKEWEKKIKDSLLRKDATLGNVSSSLKTDVLKTYTINGKSYSLSSFGISTLGYFTSGDNEKGVLHIDGDTEDSFTKGNEDKLKKAIADDPETVVSFFSQLATDMYTDLTKRMGTTSLSSIYYIYNDKQMATEYSEYKTKISDQEAKIKTWEDYYYKKFSKMESALAKLNSNSSSLSGLLGQ